MFVNAGAAAFDGELTEADVSAHRSRHHSDAEAFVADHRYVGPPDDPVGTLTESVHIADWGHAGVRLTEREPLYARYAAANRLADAALAVVRRVGDALQA